MRLRLAAAIAVALACGSAAAQKLTWVNGYVKRDGTYVQPHLRTAPDSTPLNNYSTRGNVNPYSGRQGTADPYSSLYQPRSYQAPKPLSLENPRNEFSRPRDRNSFAED